MKSFVVLLSKIVFDMEHKYDFDKFIDRSGSHSMKYDMMEPIFGASDLLPMWVADSDFQTAPFVINAIKDRLDHPVLGYTGKGDEFYNSITKWLGSRHQWDIDRDMISTSPGVVASIAVSLLAYSSEGDSVIVNTPVYAPFYEVIEGVNRKIVRNQLRLEGGRYRLDLEDFESKIIDNNVKIFLFCSPHNPGGMVWTLEEHKQLLDICLRHNVLVISDEIHADLVRKKNKHIPFASIDGAEDITITLMAPSKTFNSAGLSTSFVVICNSKLMEQYNAKLMGVHIHGGNIFGNIALQAAFSEGENWLDQQLDYIEENILYAISFFKNELPEAVVVEPDGTYLLWVDLSKYGSEEEVMKRLLTVGKIALSNGSFFGDEGEGFFRINLATTKEVVKDGLNRIKNSLS